MWKQVKICPNKQTFKGKKQDSVIGHPTSREALEQDSQRTQGIQENAQLHEQRWKRPRGEPLSTSTNVEAQIWITSDGDLNVQPLCPGTAIKDKNNDHRSDYDSSSNHLRIIYFC